MNDSKRLDAIEARLGEVVSLMARMSKALEKLAISSHEDLELANSSTSQIMAVVGSGFAEQTELIANLGRDVVSVNESIILANQHAVHSAEHQVDVMRVLTTLQEVQESMAELILADTAESDAEDMH